MKLTESIYMLDLSREGRDSLSLTLLRDGERLVLVDAAFPGQYEQLKAALAAEGFSPEQVTDVILTHQDIDHIGCIGELKVASPGLRVLAHTLEAPYVDGRETPVKLAALEKAPHLTEGQEAFMGMLKTGFSSRRHPIDRELTTGETLPLCGGVEVFHTPGHTPGHICLLVREAGVLITGDALNCAEGRLSGPNPAYTQDLPQALESLRQLLGQGITKAIVYHGGLWEGEFDAALQPLLPQE